MEYEKIHFCFHYELCNKISLTHAILDISPSKNPVDISLDFEKTREKHSWGFVGTRPKIRIRSLGIGTVRFDAVFVYARA